MIVSKRMHRLKNASFFFFFVCVSTLVVPSVCVHVRRWTHSIHAKNGWLFFFFLSLMWLLFAAETHPFQQRWQSRFWNLLFYFMVYVIEHIHFFFFALPFWFVLCLCFVFPAVAWGFSFFFLFSWSSAFSLCYIPPYFFPSIAAFLSSFAFLFVVVVSGFFFCTHPASDVSLFATGLFFFFSFNNSLLRTRK